METQSTTHESRDAQAQALADIGLERQRHQNDDVEDVVRAAQRNGMDGLTRSEIRERLELITSRRWEGSTVSRCVNGLIAAERLVQLGQRRECSVTGRVVTVVAVPAVQARLVP
ncbi:hypothetical protein [Caldimonas tepidiphila]|uniref:hypothetical protein n=1 Tax=Caldimonas tepidiphila TaxID=2315841 RepID=UPI0013008D71|nr:hypothetical protein [Caldimonas tepidiphila]